LTTTAFSTAATITPRFWKNATGCNLPKTASLLKKNTPCKHANIIII